MDEHPAYPVRIEGELDADLSRWLWVVKWLLAIPHYVVLAFLWLTLLVLTVVAFFAILITGRYPRGIFDFNLGVLRWTWRVAFYSYGALGTDRYPPFTLDDVADYPARLHVEYPDGLSRGLVLVKWWLLAIPHYVVVGILLGGGGYAASPDGRVGMGAPARPDRDSSCCSPEWRCSSRPLPARDLRLRSRTRPLGRACGELTCSSCATSTRRSGSTRAASRRGRRSRRPSSRSAEPVAAETPPPAERSGGTAGRVVLIVVGVIAGIVAFALLAGGCALVAVDRRSATTTASSCLRARTSPRRPTPSCRRAPTSTPSGAEWALDTFLGTVRIRSDSDERDVFVGIGPAADVDAYLDGVEHDEVTDLKDEPNYDRVAGGAPAGPPGDQQFWAESASGTGELTVDWEPEDGVWRVVLMNADAARGVSSDMSIGAELDSVLWIGIGMLLAGGLLAAGAALAITAGVASPHLNPLSAR